MKRNLLFWLPRGLALAFIGFLSLFSLDVFEMQAPLPQLLLGFLIHSIPSILLLIALLVAWKKEKIGGVLFILLAVAMFFFVRSELGVAIPFSGLILVIGLLFLWNGYRQNSNPSVSL